MIEFAKKVDISCLTTDGPAFYQNGLYAAAQMKDEDKSLQMIRVLVQHGISIRSCNDSLKQTPLYYAVREGHEKVIKMLVQGGLNVNHLDCYGQNPVYYCISAGNVPITRLLVSYGADPDVVDLNGQTPAYYAVKSGHFEMVEYLISLKINLNTVDLRQKTLSHWARQYSRG